jgi:hypothetical protein
MMFHKQYYKLDEAAQKLGVDVDFIAQSKGLFKKSLANDSYDSWYIFSKNELPPISLPCKSIIPNELGLGDYESIDDFTIKGITSFQVCNNDVNDWGCDVYECRPLDLLRVITHQELTRLLALKAEHDGKPTAEQLQQQLGEAKARIAELEAAQSNDTKQPIQQQREQALLFWVQGMGRDTVMAMTKPQIHDALKKIDPIFRFSDFDKFWQKQRIIKLEAGKPTR